MSNKNFRTIAIILGDNDFYSTFYNLLENIYSLLVYNSNLTKENIIDAIGQGVPYFYYAFQHDCRNDNIDNTLEYLSNITILFDEEAEKDISSNYHDHGAWYLECQTGKVYSY